MKPTKAKFGRIIPNPKLKLLDQVREVCRLKHFSPRTYSGSRTRREAHLSQDLLSAG